MRGGLRLLLTERSSVIRPVVLVADDYPAVLEFARVFLSELGYSVLVARDGAEAVKQAREHRPDVIVMDMFMPVMDGVTAARTLKASDCADIPIIAYTAKPSVAAANRHLFAAVCPKPSEPSRLSELIARAVASE